MRNINMDCRLPYRMINSKKTNGLNRVHLGYQASSSSNNSGTNGCIAEGHNAAENTQLHNKIDTGSALNHGSFSHLDYARRLQDIATVLGVDQSDVVPRRSLPQVQHVGVQAFDRQQFGSLPNIGCEDRSVFGQMPLNYGNVVQFLVGYPSYRQHLAAPVAFYGMDQSNAVPAHSQPQFAPCIRPHALDFQQSGFLHNMAFEGGNNICQMPFGHNNADQLLGGNMHINSVGEGYQYDLQTMQPTQLAPEGIESSDVIMWDADVGSSEPGYDQHEVRQQQEHLVDKNNVTIKGKKSIGSTKRKNPEEMSQFTKRTKLVHPSSSKTASLPYRTRDSKGEEKKHVVRKKIVHIMHAVKCSRQTKNCSYPGCKANMERLLDGLSGDKSGFLYRVASLLSHNRQCQGCELCLKYEAKLCQQLDHVMKWEPPADGTPAESVTPSASKASEEISQFPKGMKTEHLFHLNFCQNGRYPVAQPLKSCNETDKAELEANSKSVKSSSLDEVSVTKYNMEQIKETISIPRQHIDQSEAKTESQKEIVLATKPSNGFDQENEVTVTLLHSTTLATCEIGEDMYPPSSYKKTEHASLVEFSHHTKTYQAVELAKMQIEADKIGQEAKCMETAPSSDCGHSLTEFFTPEQIRKHILSLKESFDQSVPKAVAEGLNEEASDANKCDLCGEGSRFFEPRLYCTGCSRRILVGAKYYIRRNHITTTTAGDSEDFYCDKCYKMMSYELEKKENKRIGEKWVQCDKCNSWQHQICALFNGSKNKEKTKYTCPNCLLQSAAQRVIPQGTVLGAKDLPKTKLSDDIEQRLARRLTEEREKRATKSGKNSDEVSSAEDLVVRVVSSVNKKVEVLKLFQKIVQEKDYPSEFPYKSKAILLFQKIDGADVCLLGIYAQEFGAECAKPNQRRVCLSYIDSVKYFRPDIQSESGEPLRTFVYHEILVGYLDYCKKRGFASFYIWVCPPCGKDDDYIFHCRPKAQKTHSVDKLRKWYQKLIVKATDENIVVNATNLYNEFLNPHGGECEVKATAARLPYFDGDYWPRVARAFLLDSRNTLQSERSLRAGRHDTENGYTEDIILQNHIKDSIEKKKANYIMLHFQHTCRCCCEHILSGRSWVCRTCKKIHFCDRCYDKQLKLDKGNRHPIKQPKKHSFDEFEVARVPEFTNDEDQDIQNKICDTREALLNFCRRENYRFDTLRRAKHSTMMLLDYLHN